MFAHFAQITKENTINTLVLAFCLTLTLSSITLQTFQQKSPKNKLKLRLFSFFITCKIIAKNKNQWSGIFRTLKKYQVSILTQGTWSLVMILTPASPKGQIRHLSLKFFVIHPENFELVLIWKKTKCEYFVSCKLKELNL